MGARLRGDQSRWGLGIIAVLFLLLGTVPLALSGAGLLGVPTVPSATPTPTATNNPEGISVPVTMTPTEPPATPIGTPAPKPSEATEVSASVSPPPPPPAATPTPTPQPGLWRVEGYVVDESGNPLKNVCVVVGPRGCQPQSPHTDDRGHYFLDVAANKEVPTAFDFYFEMPGRETVWWHVVPGGPTEFNVVLKQSN